MHPDFERYRDEMKGKGSANPAMTARVPEKLKTMIDFIAEVEGDSTAALIVEGIARVVEDRLTADGLKELERKINQQHEEGRALIEVGLRVQQSLQPRPE